MFEVTKGIKLPTELLLYAVGVNTGVSRYVYPQQEQDKKEGESLPSLDADEKQG
jgi:hypothetical protein